MDQWFPKRQGCRDSPDPQFDSVFDLKMCSELMAMQLLERIVMPPVGEFRTCTWGPSECGKLRHGLKMSRLVTLSLRLTITCTCDLGTCVLGRYPSPDQVLNWELSLEAQVPLYHLHYCWHHTYLPVMLHLTPPPTLDVTIPQLFHLGLQLTGLVEYRGLDQNISIKTWWIAMKCRANTHGAQRMNPYNFDQPFTFHCGTIIVSEL